MKNINRDNPLPLYAQVREILQREIESGFKPGDSLAAEPELEKRFGVSRVTIRRALDELESEGLIVRKQGRGTFVSAPRITQELNRLVSWGETMRQLGYAPQTAACEIETVEPTRELAAMLQTGPDTRLVRVRRVRLAGGEPFCIMTNYLPEGLIPGLAEQGLVEDSIYRTLARYHRRPASAADRVEARAATGREAAQLQVKTGEPLLQVTRLVSDAGGRPLYVAIIAYRADKYSYTVNFGANSDQPGS